MIAKTKKDMSYLESVYQNDVAPMLQKKYDIKNFHCIPKISKVVVSMRLGRDGTDKKATGAAMKELSLITGRQPAYSKVRKSISGFKILKGQMAGAYCTLRGRIAYEFLERLILIALPRIRDFRGYSTKSLDKHYSLNIGIKEHTIFRELSHDNVYKPRGLDICINALGIDSEEMAVDFLRGLKFPIKALV